jgi:hypothetical protein
MRHLKGQSVDEFNTRFTIEIQKSGMDDQTNGEILGQMYGQALQRELAQRILINGNPPSLSEWMRQASTLDGYARRARSFFAHTTQTNTGQRNSRGQYRGGKQKQPWKPREYTPRNDNYGEPMEIDRLSPEEEKKRKENDLCFNCGIKGHFSRDCQKPRQEGSGQRQGGQNHQYTQNRGRGRGRGNGRNFQGNRSGGKQRQQAQIREIETSESPEEKAERTRTEIRAIIAQNYDDTTTEEYVSFVQEFDNMGF